LGKNSNNSTQFTADLRILREAWGKQTTANFKQSTIYQFFTNKIFNLFS
jgi:hypothetical protein